MGTFYHYPLSSILFLVLLIIAIFEHHILVLSKTHPTDIQVLKDLKNGLDSSSISPGSCLSSWDFSFDPCDHIFTDRFTCGFRCDVNISRVNRVTEISLDQAGYSGSLSNTSWNLPYLHTLDLSFNSLLGPVPYSLSNLTLIRRLSLSKNFFTGPIPSSLGSLSFLEELYLDNNNLTGQIPGMFNSLLSLKRLELEQNNLSGEIPELDQLHDLYYIDLSDNTINGEFPSTFPASIVELSS